MTSTPFIGDLSRTFQLRQANAQLKSRLATLSQEAATGQHADTSAALGGELGRLAQVQSRLAILDDFRNNASGAALELQGTQNALESIQQVAENSGSAMWTESMAFDPGMVALRSRQAASDLQDVVGLMNVQVGGRYVLSGTATRTAPLPGSDQLMQAAKGVAAGLTDGGDIADAVSAWFDAAPGAGGFLDTMYQGSSTGRVSQDVAPGITVQRTLTAEDQSLRGVLKGLVMASLAADGSLGLDAVQGSELLRRAGQQLTGSSYMLTQARAEVGMLQHRVEAASVRNATEQTSLQVALSDMLGADPYDTATALAEAEGNLQNLYALTARLSRLSLTDYL